MNIYDENKSLISKIPEGINVRCSWLTASLFFILFFTSLNALFQTINYEYGVANFWECTNLGEPADVHSDLIKSALSLAQTRPPYLWAWSPHYQRFYLDNPFRPMEEVSQGHLSIYHLAPFTFLIIHVTLLGILLTSPVFIAFVTYLVCLGLLWCACWCLVTNVWERIFAFLALALSYPFLFMLAHLSFGGAVVGILLVFYIYLACNRQGILLAILCLAFACNIRPNAILLTPLLLCYGFRRSIGASALFLAIGGGIALASHAVIVKLYPGYSWEIMGKALEVYSNDYIVGSGGMAYNSSAFGAIKIIYLFLFWNLSPGVLLLINKIIAGTCILLIGLTCYKFMRGLIPVYYFAFALVSLYILATTIFGIYHIIVIYFFILAAGSRHAKAGKLPPLLLIVASLMIIPKNYIFIYPMVSIEELLNPLILAGCLFWILTSKFSTASPIESPDTVAPLLTAKKTKRG